MVLNNQLVEQAVVVPQGAISYNKGAKRISLFNEDGSPLKAVVKGELVSYSADNNVKGDGVTDDSAAFNAWLTSASALGARMQLAPGSTVRVTTSLLVPSGTRLDLNGSTIKNAAAGVNDRMITISGRTGVTISNGVLDGDKASFATVTEQRHNLYIINSTNVTIQNVTSKNAKGDGIYIGDDINGKCNNVVLIEFRAETNHRNGGSITACKRFRQYGGHYIGNGGTSPHSGFDVEPNVDGIEISDGAFYGVGFDLNVGDGILVQSKSATPTQPQRAWRFYGCTANSNGTGAIATFGNGVVLRWSNDVLWEGGEIRDNLLRGVYFRDTCVNLRFKTDVVTNAQEGYGQPAGTITGLLIEGVCSGNGTSGTYDGINLAGAGSFLNLRAIVNTNTRYGLRTVPGWSSITIAAGCGFTGNTTGTVSLSDTSASRLVYALGISGGVVPVGRSTTALRPVATSVSFGMWIDTTLNKIIWSNGVDWRDAMGTIV